MAAVMAPAMSRNTRSTACFVFSLSTRQRDEIVFAYSLQDEEGRRGLAAVGDEVRAARRHRIGLAGLEAHLLLGVLEEDSQAPLQDIEGVLYVAVVVPRHL